MKSEVLIVGELNPYGANPRMALYHLPRHASGNRLREHLGLTDAQYEKLDKINLCCGKWSMTQARATVAAIKELTWPKVVILLGAKVRTAFNVPGSLKFFEMFRCGPAAVSLPHPSGRNLLWNDPTARQKARDLLRSLCPSIYAE